MAEGWEVWSSYRPSDFLMFAPRTYWRLVGLHNAQAWPLHLLVLLAGSAVGWGLWRSKHWAPRALLVLLAAAWATVAWGWHFERYAAINPTARWFAAGFALQATLWLLAAVLLPQGKLPPSAQRVAAAGLFAALLAYPLLGLLLGRPLIESEWLALAADPTLLASLGSLLLARRIWLWPLPLLWCVVSGLTLWTMGELLQAWLLPAAALATIGLAIGRRSAGRSA